MPARSTSPRPWAVFLVTWLLFSALAALWSVATPLAASPDEPAHIVKAASVVRGAFNNTDKGKGALVEVPQYIAWTHAQTCTAFNAEATAACIQDAPGDLTEIVDSTTTAGRYNPVYYLIVGSPSLVFENAGGIYAMRIVSGVLVSVFLALTVMVLAGWRARTLPVIAFGAAMTPMVFFLTGSVNPNALEVAATLAAFTAVTAVIVRPNPALLAQRATIIAVAGVIAANTRAISPLWVAIALLVPFILASREQIRGLVRSRPVIISASVVVVGAAAALLWLRLTNTVATSSEAGGEAPEVPYAGSSPITGFALMMLKFSQHLHEMIGVFGWLDTASPAEVYALWGLFFGGLVIAAVVVLRGRQLIFALVLIVAVPIVPALVQAAFITSGGWIWQGRYALPVLVIALVGLGIMLADPFAGLARRTRVILTSFAAAIWLVCQVLAFVTALQRYTVGASGSWFEMVLEPQWQPPGGVVLVLLAFLAVASLTTVLAFRWALGSPDEGEPADLAAEKTPDAAASVAR